MRNEEERNMFMENLSQLRDFNFAMIEYDISFEKQNYWNIVKIKYISTIH